MINMTDQVKSRRDGPVGTVILDHPARLNALTPRMVSAIRESLEDMHTDGRIRVVLITGSGDSFCSGTDLNTVDTAWEGDRLPDLDADDVLAMQDLLEYMLRFPRPILAAVHGWVVGTGLALMLTCDIVFAGEGTRFWMPESTLGLSAGLTVPLLSWRLGSARAAAMSLKGEPVDSATALSWGLVHERCNDSLVWARASEVARSMAKQAPESLQLIRNLMNETIAESLFTHLSIGAAHTATARTTQVAAERVQEFLKGKEPPADIES